MRYFLVEGTVAVTGYMEPTVTRQETRLVVADDLEDAEDKFIRYWERKTVEYSVRYYVESVCAHETIE